MNKYYDYFKEQEHDSVDEVTMDEFMRPFQVLCKLKKLI